MKFDVEFVIKRPHGNLRISDVRESKNLKSLLLHLSAFNDRAEENIIGVSIMPCADQKPEHGCTVRCSQDEGHVPPCSQA